MTFQEFLQMDVAKTTLNNNSLLNRISHDTIEWYLLGIGFMKKPTENIGEHVFVCNKNNKEYSINLNSIITLDELQYIIYIVSELTHKNPLYILQALFMTSELHYGAKANA